MRMLGETMIVNVVFTKCLAIVQVKSLPDSKASGVEWSGRAQNTIQDCTSIWNLQCTVEELGQDYRSYTHTECEKTEMKVVF